MPFPDFLPSLPALTYWTSSGHGRYFYPSVSCKYCELLSAYHPCGLLEVGASRVILHQPTFISHLLIGLSPFTLLEDGRLLSEKAKGSYFYFNNFSFSNLASSPMISSNFLLNDNVLSSVNPYSFTH